MTPVRSAWQPPPALRGLGEDLGLKSELLSWLLEPVCPSLPVINLVVQFNGRYYEWVRAPASGSALRG